jgi:hypothetical protein
MPATHIVEYQFVRRPMYIGYANASAPRCRYGTELTGHHSSYHARSKNGLTDTNET